MAVQIIRQTVCDKCHASIHEPDHTIGFSYRGKGYRIDLCKECKEMFDKLISPIIKVARASSQRRSKSQAEDEWAWLESQGFIRHRGRKSAAETLCLAAFLYMQEDDKNQLENPDEK